ncbi:MAG TPA: TRAP transporter small permease [Spirochaetia bacterium]|nr:TRAP transporter small permease [Spirochaetia bacterium]
MANWLKKTGTFLLDCIELYVPILTFSTLFVSFVSQIFARKLFRPLIWPEELSLICFIWTALLGGLYSKRMGTQVAFTMLYDAVKPKTKRIMRIAGNALLLVAFLIILVPSWNYIQFMAYKKSDALRIPMNVAYFPFIVYLLDMIIRLIVDIVKDFTTTGGTR